MAWRSSGNTNEEMVDNLKKYGVISSDFLITAFKNVDRKYFVPKDNQDAAYSDQPLKEGHVHISAPHIYGSALEALELQPNSSLSFCNIGSGTGYLSCIVASVLGPKSVNYGIEIYPEVVEHCNSSINEWKRSKRNNVGHLEIVHGNALNVSMSIGESIVGFDRIYIGASVDKPNLSKITKLLSPGGILVGPVDDELVKIIRIGPLNHASDSNEFTQQILSGVRFASLVTFPAMETILPSRLWSPQLQPFFPDSYQKASMELLLCSNSKLIQPLPTPPSRVNLAATLPRVIWLEILSYTHRKWFDSKESETQFLKKRLLEEQANAAKAQQARADAEARCHIAERERDVYRLLARRWQSRLQLVLQHQRNLVESGRVPDLPQIETEATDALVALLPHRSYEEDQDSTSMEEDNEEDEQILEFLDQQDSDDEYDFHSLQSDQEDAGVASRNDDESVTMDDASEIQKQSSPVQQSREIRTVSMCSVDL